VYIGNEQEALMSSFSWRCQYCNWAFQLTSEEVAAALATADATQARHYVVHCPRCRKALKIPVDQLRHHAPIGVSAATSAPIRNLFLKEDEKTMTDISSPYPPIVPPAPVPPVPPVELPAPSSAPVAPASPKPAARKPAKKKPAVRKPAKKTIKRKPAKKAVRKAAKKPVKKAAKKTAKKKSRK
jgi:hypothetical protein